MAWTYEPFVASDKFSMETMNNKLADIVGWGATELNAISTAMSKLGNCKIEIKSYVGNGKSGSSYKNSLTFSGAPLFVFIQSEDDGHFIVVINGCNQAVIIREASYPYPIVTSWSGNTFTWYRDASNQPNLQLNESNKTYYCVALINMGA